MLHLNRNLEGLTWAIARVVKGEGPRNANKHNNPAELITFPQSICYNSAGCRMPDAGCRMPDAGCRMAPLVSVGSGMKVSPWRRGCRFRPCSPLLPLLLSLPLVAGLVSEAQAQTTFVKNTGQTTVSNTLQSFTRDTAQAFTTGGNAAGYKLTSVVFKFRTLYNNSPSFTVAIYTNSSGSPGNSLGTLTNPALSAGDYVEYTFTASGQGIDLEANTQYWIVIDNTSTSVVDTTMGWAITASDSEDAGAASGWSIANSKGDRSSTSTGSFTSETDVLQIEIIGTAKTANTAATGA
ncbi:MAG: hypothetical protein F4025_05520, partial [Synechococcus sp. SB0669_bin_7]|nr:hypothetical protein [Synechococcus sp. SB0669_bin_7]